MSFQRYWRLIDFETTLCVIKAIPVRTQRHFNVHTMWSQRYGRCIDVETTCALIFKNVCFVILQVDAYSLASCADSLYYERYNVPMYAVSSSYGHYNVTSFIWHVFFVYICSCPKRTRYKAILKVWWSEANSSLVTA